MQLCFRLCGFRDSATTAMLVMAGCAGESFMPILLGQLMRMFGPKAFPVFTMLAIAVMVSAFISLHVSLNTAMKAMRAREEGRDIDNVIQHAETRARSLSKSRRNPSQSANCDFAAVSDAALNENSYLLVRPQQSQRQKEQQQHHHHTHRHQSDGSVADLRYGADGSSDSTANEWIEQMIQNMPQRRRGDVMQV